MQSTRRRVGALTSRSFSKTVSSRGSDRLASPAAYENVEVVKTYEDNLHKIRAQSFVNWIWETLLQRPVADGLGRIENATTSSHGFSDGITFSNFASSQRGNRGGNTMFCCSMKEDQFSIERSARPLTNKLWNSGAFSDSILGNYLLKTDVRGGFKHWVTSLRGSVRSLHTEMKGEKHEVEKSENVATRSPLKTKTSTAQRRRMLTRVGSTATPPKTSGDLEVPNSLSIAEDLVPASSTELESESQTDTEEEIGTAWQEAFRELDDEDLEEVQEEGFGPSGQIVQMPVETVDQFQHVTVIQNEEMDRRASAQAMALLRAALDEADEEEGEVEVEFQRSLRIGIVGAPNAGKSLLTNQLVGSRVSAVSRKTNTTHREHLGVYTKGDTQLLYYDTPGLHLDVEGSPLRVDVQHRVRNAWEIVDFCEALVVLVDAERQIRRPDKRVQRLVEKLGKEEMVSQKRVLCLNKVDIIKNKRTLLPLAKQFEDLHGYDRIFMISALTGSGVRDVTDYLVNQAVLRPWDEDPENKDHRDIALEVVREQVFEHLHEELPHTTKQKLVSWKVLKDGSIRIQQLLLVAKKEHQKILVGKDGAVIGDIGIKARKELTEILGKTVHLVLDVKLMSGSVIGDQ
ncbi:unnamed protein product [Calypogeia fissa]